MERLTDLPNIGSVLCANLRKLGVEMPEELRTIGIREALMRIRAQVDPVACLYQLQALEGAVRGVKKASLPPEEKEALRAFFRGLG